MTRSSAMHKSVRFALLAWIAGCGRCSDEPKPATPSWRAIPGGEQRVGSAADEPCRDADETQRLVAMAEFAIAPHEVTQGAFHAVMGRNPSFHRDCDKCPVDSVTAVEAEAYCKKLGGRLPDENEWERAARAGTSTPFHGGALESCMATDAVAGRVGWYKANSGGFSHPVGEKEPNAFGLYDMSGNVYEWTSTSEGDRRVVRGGSWYHNAHHARSANRMTVLPSKRLSYVGFRCVRAEP